MHTGYYKELEDINAEDEGASFEVMEILNIFSEEPLDMYKYLHGYCDDFACALNRKYGYDIESIWSESGKLIHAFCVKPALHEGEKNYYIDARGITDNWKEFIEEFRDEYSDDLYDEPVCEIEVNHSANDFIDMCVIERGKDWNYVETPEIQDELKKIINSKGFQQYDVTHIINKEYEKAHSLKQEISK